MSNQIVESVVIPNWQQAGTFELWLFADDSFDANVAPPVRIESGNIETHNPVYKRITTTNDQTAKTLTIAESNLYCTEDGLDKGTATYTAWIVQVTSSGDFVTYDPLPFLDNFRVPVTLISSTGATLGKNTWSDLRLYKLVRIPVFDLSTYTKSEIDSKIAGVASPFTVQSANRVYAGPSSGSAALPGFRALVSADIPALTVNIFAANVFDTDGTLAANSPTRIPAQSAVKTYVDAQIAGGTVPDATTLVKGKVKLAGDLSGTADLPTVPGLAAKASLASPIFTGTVTIPSPFTLGATSVSASGAEVNRLVGVTSAIQTQLDGKQAGPLTGDVTTSGAAATIASNAVTDAKLRQSAGLSLIGRSANSTGNVADIAAGADFNIFRRSGASIGFGSIDLAQSGAVGSSILGIPNGGTGSATQNFVDLSTTQSSIAGAKSFTSNLTAPLLDKGGQIFNVVAYGADPTGVSDSLAAFNSAKAAAVAASGGVITGPRGTYLLSDTFTIGDGTSTTISTYSGVSLVFQSGNRMSVTPASAMTEMVKLKYTGSALSTKPVIKVSGPVGGVKLGGFTVDGQGNAGIGVQVMHSEGAVIEDVQVYNVTNLGLDIDSYGVSSFNSGTRTTNNYGNTGRVNNIFINMPAASSVANAIGIRIGQTGTVSQWQFYGGRISVPGTVTIVGTGGRGVQLRFADHNFFWGTTINLSAYALENRPISGQPVFPDSNYFYACPLIGSVASTHEDTTDSSWTPAQGIGFFPFLTADAGVNNIPTDSRYFGNTDTQQTFGTPSILSSSGLTLKPYGTGTGNATEIRFLELAANGTNYSYLKGQDSIAANVGWKLPGADAAGFFKSNGSGSLSVAAVNLASSDITGTLSVGNGGTGAATFTVNGLLYGNGSSAVQVSSSFSVDPTNKTLLINGATALNSTDKLHINGNTGELSFIINDGFGDAATSFPGLIFRRARNTAASPGQTLLGDVLGQIGARAYTSSAAFTNNTAAIAFTTTENVTSSAQGTKITLETTPNASTSRVVRLEITHDGHTVIYPSSTGAGQTGELRFLELVANGANYIGLKSPDAISANLTYIFPTTEPTAGQVLSAGAPSSNISTLSWISPLGTSSGLLGAIQLSTGSGGFTNDTVLNFETTNHTLGVGVTSWDTTYKATIQSANALGLRVAGTAAGGTNILLHYVGTPLSAGGLGGITFGADTDITSAGSSANGVKLSAVATENWIYSTNLGSALAVEVTPAGSGTRAEAFRFTDTGNFLIGTATDGGYRLEARKDDSVTNAVTDMLRLAHTSSGTVAASFGTGILTSLEAAGGTLRDASRIATEWTDATDATPDSRIRMFTSVDNVLTEAAKFDWTNGNQFTSTSTSTSIRSLASSPGGLRSALEFRLSGFNGVAGDGISMLFSAPDAAGNNENLARVSGVLEIATNGSERGKVVFSTRDAASGDSTASLERMSITGLGNVVVGTAALVTTATDGFLYIPASAGAPTGVPTSYTGRVALHYDSTNNNLYVYNGAWRKVAVAP